jgi:hypothetical protein
MVPLYGKVFFGGRGRHGGRPARRRWGDNGEKRMERRRVMGWLEGGAEEGEDGDVFGGGGGGVFCHGGGPFLKNGSGVSD